MSRRVRLRPRPEDWEADDLMTLAEAAAIFYPNGPLTETSLRTAIKQGTLAVEKIAGKLYVTPTYMKDMRSRCRVDPKGRASTSANVKADRPSGSSSMTADLKRAQVAVHQTVRELRESLRGI